MDRPMRSQPTGRFQLSIRSSNWAKSGAGSCDTAAGVLIGFTPPGPAVKVGRGVMVGGTGVFVAVGVGVKV